MLFAEDEMIYKNLLSLIYKRDGFFFISVKLPPKYYLRGSRKNQHIRTMILIHFRYQFYFLVVVSGF